MSYSTFSRQKLARFVRQFGRSRYSTIAQYGNLIIFFSICYYSIVYIEHNTYDINEIIVYVRQDISGASNPTSRRQKTWDLLDQSALTQAKQQKQSAQV